MLEKLTIDSFTPHVGSSFHLEAEGLQSMELTLESVDPVGQEPKPDEQRQRPFSLLFLGPLEPTLPQQMVPLRHAVMGGLDLFLVPLGPNEKGMIYEAVFN